MGKTDVFVSAVAVVRDDAPVLPAFVADVTAVLDAAYTNYEVLLVDNGSADGTPAAARQLLAAHPCVRYVRLGRTVDPETALMAGLDAAIGDFVATLSPDFDPPREVVPMVEACRAGTDLILGVARTQPSPGPLYRLLRTVFRRLARWMVRLEPVDGATGFRVLSRQAVNALTKVRLRRRFFAVLAADVGLTPGVHPYDPISRSGRSPRPPLARAVRTGLSVLVHTSIFPLRVASVLGLAGSALSLAYSLYAVGVFLLNPNVAAGWTTLSLAMSGLFAVAFLILALMGEYLGRVLEESADRPLYLVRDEQSSAVMLTDVARPNVLDRADDPAPAGGA